MSGYYAITGIQEGLDPSNTDEPKPLRQEVDAWLLDSDNDKQISLFLVALARFQNQPVDDTLSYWQVAGIHGQPYIPWDEKTEPQAKDLGYCTHNSLLFPTWHRPYVTLFEQRIYEIMLEVIAEFPEDDQPDWRAAAKTWRLPYWDWAEKKSRDIMNPEIRVYDVPLIVKTKDVTVWLPDSDGANLVQTTIPNPMYKFTTPDGLPMGDPSYGENGLKAVSDGTDTFYYNICKATSRQPPKFDLSDTASVTAWIDGVQNNSEVAEALYTHDWYQNSKKLIYTDTLSEAVYHMFAEDAFPSYPAFATTRYVKELAQDPQKYLNLEDIHNNIHNWTGGATGGFMVEVAVAAFDPLFWLHHCNVDRQLAIWQTLNKDSWFEDRDDQFRDTAGNWSTKPGTVCTPETPLAPFRDNTGQYYTSNSARDWATLGYAYPELQRWEYTNEDAYLASIRGSLFILYSSIWEIIWGERGPWSTIPADHTGPMRKEHLDYVINVRFERYALAGKRFTIHFILADKYHAGSVFNFCSPPIVAEGDVAGCANCRQQLEEGTIQKGQVNLTSVLLRAREDGVEELNTWDPEKIDAYLTANLTWKIVGPQYQEIPVDQISSLKIYVARGEGVQFKDHKVPTIYRNYKAVRSITRDRHGGLGDTDDL